MREFIEKNAPEMVVESIESRIQSLVDAGIFTNLGEDYIRGKFKEYQDKGVVPSELISSNATKKAGSDTKSRMAAGLKTRPATEKETEEMLYWVFRFVDKDVKDALMRLETAQDPKVLKKINRHYDGTTQKPAVEDYSEISTRLVDYYFFKGKKGFGESLPKSLREKLDYRSFSEKVRKANEKYETGLEKEKEGEVKSDVVVPEGFELLRKSGNLELYKWTKATELCGLSSDFGEKSKWFSQERTKEGGVSHTWCVGHPDTAAQYGKPDSEGNFKYPFHVIKKDGKPYILMHGNRLEAKDSLDDPITEEMADEVYEPLLSNGMLEEILAEHL